MKDLDFRHIPHLFHLLIVTTLLQSNSPDSFLLMTSHFVLLMTSHLHLHKKNWAMNSTWRSPSSWAKHEHCSQSKGEIWKGKSRTCDVIWNQLKGPFKSSSAGMHNIGSNVARGSFYSSPIFFSCFFDKNNLWMCYNLLTLASAFIVSLIIR